MKNFLVLLFFITSIQAFAFSEITLNRYVEGKREPHDHGLLTAWVSKGRCSFKIERVDRGQGVDFDPGTKFHFEGKDVSQTCSAQYGSVECNTNIYGISPDDTQLYVYCYGDSKITFDVINENAGGFFTIN